MLWYVTNRNKSLFCRKKRCNTPLQIIEAERQSCIHHGWCIAIKPVNYLLSIFSCSWRMITEMKSLLLLPYLFLILIECFAILWSFTVSTVHPPSPTDALRSSGRLVRCWLGPARVGPLRSWRGLHSESALLSCVWRGLRSEGRPVSKRSEGGLLPVPGRTRDCSDSFEPPRVA